MERSKKRMIIFVVCAGVFLFILWLSAKRSNILYQDDGYRYVLGVCQENLKTGSQLAFKNDIVSAASQREDINVLFYSADGDVEEQIRQLHILQEQGADCIIVSAEMPELLESALEMVHSNGTALIVMGDLKTRVTCDVVIRTDHFEMGKAAGAYFVKQGGGLPLCFLEIQGTPRIPRTKELQRGFRTIINDAPSMTSPHVIVGYDSFNTTMQRIMQSGIQDAAMPVTAVFSHGYEMALAAAEVFSASDGSPRIMSVGGNPSGHAAENQLEAMVLIPTGGAEAFSFAEKLIRGETTPSEYTLPITVVNAENAASGNAREVPR